MSDWSEAFSDPPADLQVHYRAGSPRSEVGEGRVIVFGSGRVQVQHRQGADLHAWEGRLEADFSRIVFAALKASGFPDTMSHTVPPGPGMISLEVVNGQDSEVVMLNAPFATEHAEMRQLIDLFDAIEFAVAGGKGRTAVAPEAPPEILHRREIESGNAAG